MRGAFAECWTPGESGRPSQEQPLAPRVVYIVNQAASAYYARVAALQPDAADAQPPYADRRTGSAVAQARPVPASPPVHHVQPNLLHRVASGDGGAVRECVERYGGLVWSLARRLALSDAEAEDAVQEIFIEIWNNAYRYDPSVASETAFVAMIARRRLIDRRRKLNRQPDRAVLPDDAVGPATRAQPDRGEIGEEAVRAAKAVEQLSSEQQRVLRLSIYQGLSHEEISRSTGMPLGTVKTHARRGLIRVRELLNVSQADPQQPNGAGGAS